MLNTVVNRLQYTTADLNLAGSKPAGSSYAWSPTFPFSVATSRSATS